MGVDGKVDAYPAKISEDTRSRLEDNLAIFYTGYSRSAYDMLADQNKRANASDSAMLENLHNIKALGHRVKDALEKGETQQFGELLNEHWQHKRKRSEGMSNTRIDELYSIAMQNGAIGGKLIGAGGGGFLMFYTEEKNKLRNAMQKTGTKEMRFRFDFTGTTLLGDRN